MGTSGGHNKMHAPVEVCARLDCAELRKAGIFATPYPSHVWQWNYVTQGQPADTIRVMWTKPGQILAAVLQPVDRARVYQTIRVSFTSCNYGAARAWMHCPNCDRRVFRLYVPPVTATPALACRHCWHLTYRIRQSSGIDYGLSRIDAAMRRFTRHGAQPVQSKRHDLPARPPGMHRATYNRLAAQLLEAQDITQDAYIQSLTGLLSRSAAGRAVLLSQP
jgi:hypothetical protein